MIYNLLFIIVYSTFTLASNQRHKVHISRPPIYLFVDSAIYVSKTGSDTNSGTISHPLLTIQKGVFMAAAQSKPAVNIEAGIYGETVTLRSAISLYGGFQSGFQTNNWTRNPQAYQTTIQGNPRAIVGDSVKNIPK